MIITIVPVPIKVRVCVRAPAVSTAYGTRASVVLMCHVYTKVFT